MHLQRLDVDKCLSRRWAKRAEEATDSGYQRLVREVDAGARGEEPRQEGVAGCVLGEESIEHVVDGGPQNGSETAARDRRVNGYAVVGIRVGIRVGILRS